MRVCNLSNEELNSFYSDFKKYAEASNNGKIEWVKYLDLGSFAIKIINYSPEFTKLVNTQIPYNLHDKLNKKHDATIVLWKNSGTKKYVYDRFDTKNPRARVNLLTDRCLEVYETPLSPNPTIRINYDDCNNNMVESYDKKNSVYYYSADRLDMEEFIKQGHLLVRTISTILRDLSNVSLVHGAVVGIDNKGVLICARGGGGKSTLTVSTLLEKDFQYVSDDYLILNRENNNVYASPIYSIITLSPRMHRELSELKTEFISDNWNKTKFILSISAYHNKFVNKLPIKACLFPNVTDADVPSVELMSKGKAVTQIIDSTLTQLGDRRDTPQVQKLLSFARDFNFYKINLSQNLKANVNVLREFIKLL
jgi:hypothetical protein